MYRICILKSTGKILEMQSGGSEDDTLRDSRLDTLRINARNAGFAEDEIEVKWVTDEEWTILLAPQAEAPRIVSLTMRQARLQMLAMGVLSQVEAAVAQAGQAAQIEWEYAATVGRDNGLFQSIKVALGFSDEQEETFFNEGSLL